MCITKKEKVKKTEGVGWKLFRRDNDSLFSTNCVPIRSEKEIPRDENKWLKATEYYIVSGEGYLSGWHIFKTKKDALVIQKHVEKVHYQHLVLRKVQYKDAKLKGPVIWWTLNDFETTCVVAKQMKILKGGQQCIVSN